MDISTGQYVQLVIALFSGVVLFAVAYIAPVKYIVAFLILTIPFQLISSRYGTVNMVLIYLAGVALMLRGKIRLFPLLWAVVGILLAYLLSLSFTLRATYFDHILYLVSVGSNFLIFYIAYNYFRESRDLRSSLNIFVWVAGLVGAYCMLSLLVGFERFAFMNIQELSLGWNLEEKQRLVGPFNAPGTNAEFLALQILLLGYILLYEKKRLKKIFLLGLMAASFAFLVATGSRGGFIGLIGGAVLFLFLFKKELGAKGIFGGGLIMVSLGVVALAVVQLTEFNVLFKRLGEPEFEGVVPDTRTLPFESALKRIPESPILGHGPRIMLINEAERRIPGYEPFGGYPHSLYLFLLYTVGITGLLAYLVFFAGLLFRWQSARSADTPDKMLKGLPELAIILMLMFLASQSRIEFLRFILNDYQNYMFALWGMLLAYSDNLKSGTGVSDMMGDIPVQPRLLAVRRRTLKNIQDRRGSR